jgi:hypothetical protein
MAQKSKPYPKHSRRAKAQSAEIYFADRIAKQAVSISAAEDRLTKVVRAGVAKALREPRAVASQAFDTVAWKTQEAMTAARSVGGDVLVSARSVTRGVLLGVSDAGGDTVAAAGHAVRATINSAAEAGNEAVVVGKRALQGAVDAAQSVGADTAATAREAVSSVADLVLSAGETAAGLVDRLVKGALTLRGKAGTMGKAKKGKVGRKRGTRAQARSKTARLRISKSA